MSRATPSPGRSSGSSVPSGALRAGSGTRVAAACPELARARGAARPARRRPTGGGIARALARGGPSGCPTATRVATSERLDRLGGTLLVPGDPRWPAALDDLGAEAPFCLWVRGAPDLGAVLGAVGRGRRVAGGDLLRRARRVRPRGRAGRGRGRAWSPAARTASTRPRTAEPSRADGRDARRARRRRRPGLPGRATRACSRRSWVPGGALASRGAAGQPADQEPVPAAQPADRRGRPGHGRGRGGVAVGRDEHRAPRGAAPAPGRCRARAGDVDGVRRLPPAAAGRRRRCASPTPPRCASSPGSIGAELAVAGRRGADARALGRTTGSTRWRARVLDALPRRVPAELDRVASVAGGVRWPRRGAPWGSWSSTGWAVAAGRRVGRRGRSRHHDGGRRCPEGAPKARARMDEGERHRRVKKARIWTIVRRRIGHCVGIRPALGRAGESRRLFPAVFQVTVLTWTWPRSHEGRRIVRASCLISRPTWVLSADCRSTPSAPTSAMSTCFSGYASRHGRTTLDAIDLGSCAAGSPRWPTARHSRATLARRGAAVRTFFAWATRTDRVPTDPALRLATARTGVGAADRAAASSR